MGAGDQSVRDSFTDFTDQEIVSQPVVWQAVLGHLERARELLAAPGERVLFLGCGTSAFVAQSLAILREEAGLGETHWAYGSELPPSARVYDRVVAITRSGTTTEILEALSELGGRGGERELGDLGDSRAPTRTVAICAVPGMPVEQVSDEVLVLAEADERSVVQTRFPTAVLFLARAAFGADVSMLPAQCAAALQAPLPDLSEVDHFVYLGRGWGQGLATEAALKIREAAQAWAESYPALDYRHGPIAVAGDRTLVWIFNPVPPRLVADIEAVGARVATSEDDPLVQLVTAQRIAVALARLRGLDPDQPRGLSRSIILDPS